MSPGHRPAGCDLQSSQGKRKVGFRAVRDQDQGRYPTCRSGNHARHRPDSPARYDFAFAPDLWMIHPYNPEPVCSSRGSLSIRWVTVVGMYDLCGVAHHNIRQVSSVSKMESWSHCQPVFSKPSMSPFAKNQDCRPRGNDGVPSGVETNAITVYSALTKQTRRMSSMGFAPVDMRSSTLSNRVTSELSRFCGHP